MEMFLELWAEMKWWLFAIIVLLLGSYHLDQYWQTRKREGKDD